jgi:hypothetical protein
MKSIEVHPTSCNAPPPPPPAAMVGQLTVHSDGVTPARPPGEPPTSGTSSWLP